MIPPLDSPYSRNAWPQPSRDDIVVDDTHALMTRATFEQLLEYSATIPTGAYPGKMWRRHDGAHDMSCPRDRLRWLLCWYGPSDHPDFVSINTREVLIA